MEGNNFSIYVLIIFIVLASSLLLTSTFLDSNSSELASSLTSAFFKASYSSTESVSSCRDLDQSDTKYYLDSDIENCTIQINSPNLTLDCQGYALRGLNNSGPAVEINDITSNDNITVKNCYIENYTILSSIYVKDTDNVFVSNITYFKVEKGFESDNSTNITVRGLKGNQTNWHHIDLIDTTNSSVLDSKLVNSPWNGVALDHSSNNLIKNISSISTRNAVELENSEYNVITDIYSRNSGNNNVFLTQESNYNNVSHLNSSNESRHGVRIHNSTHNLIEDSYLGPTDWETVLVERQANNNTFSNLTIGGDSPGSFEFQYYAYDNEAKNLTVNGGFVFGDEAENNSVQDSWLKFVSIGENAKDNWIYDNYILNGATESPASSPGSNIWNRSKVERENVMGGNYTGGNLWAGENEDGFSYTCNDTNHDGFCDEDNLLMNESDGIQNTDFLPLSADSTPPEIYMGQNPPDNFESNNQNITFELKCVDNREVRKVELWSNWSGSWESVESNSSYNNGEWWNFTYEEVPNGTWKWGGRCVDGFNIENWTSSNRTLSVTDTIPPEVNISSPENKTYNKDSLDINFSTNEPVSSCLWNINGSNNTMEGSDKTWYDQVTLERGNYSLDGYCEDSGGNIGHNNVRFSLDFYPRLNEIFSNSTGDPNETVKFSASWSNEEDLSKFVFYLDNCTGSYSNHTYSDSFTGMEDWSNVTVSNVCPSGGTVKWYMCAEGVSGNTNCSDTLSYTVEEDEEDDEDDDSGGGGGGGIPDDEDDDEEDEEEKKKRNRFRRRIKIINPGARVSLEIEHSNMGVHKVDLSVKNKAKEVNFTMRKLEENETESGNFKVNSSERVYKFLEITASNLTEDNVKNANVSFRVEKSWIDNNNVEKDSVTLKRLYDEEWHSLETTKISEDNSTVLYKARTPGFSYFAISGDLKPCPYECCLGGSEYLDKKCSSGYKCHKNSCVEYECDSCSSDSEWSECIEGNQNKTVYVCDKSTNYKCEERFRTRECSVDVVCGDGACEGEEDIYNCPGDCLGELFFDPVTIGTVIILAIIFVSYKMDLYGKFKNSSAF